jgi:hypothetical protein
MGNTTLFAPLTSNPDATPKVINTSFEAFTSSATGEGLTDLVRENRIAG